MRSTKEVVPTWIEQRKKRDFKMRGAISQSCEETSEEVFSPKFFEKVSVKNYIFIPTTYEEYFFKHKKEVEHE